MLHIDNLQALGRWCRAHDVTWSASGGKGADVTVTLQPQSASRSWQTMRLVLQSLELRLEDAHGDAVACASDLPALLDAMEGGVASNAWS